MYDQAKHYYIFFDVLNLTYKDAWHSNLLWWHIKNSLNIKLRYPCMFRRIRIFCGRKKLNRIVKEIIFLGYDEDVWIQEV